MITGTDYTGRKMFLVRKGTGEMMKRGYKITCNDREYILDGGRAPLHYNSSGRVYVILEEHSPHNIELFPHVLGLEWSSATQVQDTRSAMSKALDDVGSRISPEIRGLEVRDGKIVQKEGS
jgi:hypothetical protein